MTEAEAVKLVIDLARRSPLYIRYRQHANIIAAMPGDHPESMVKDAASYGEAERAFMVVEAMASQRRLGI